MEVFALATADDAELVLKLYEMRREPVLRQAREWFMREFNAQSYEDFQRLCPPGGDANRFYRMVTTYWETACACMVHGAINEALFLETSGECMMVWRKISGWVGQLRAERRQPGYLRNVEETAKRMEAYRARA